LTVAFWAPNPVELSVGLVDGAVDTDAPDLVGANIVVRDFVAVPDQSCDTIMHGTCMATLIVGQGRNRMRGVVPRARLYAARAVGPDDRAEPRRVAAAIDWLVGEGAAVIALPLGAERDDCQVGAAIAAGISRGVRFFAACGSGSGRVLFPARHPGVVSVGPADHEGRLLRDARRNGGIDLLAPGWRVPGLSPNIDARLNGSSIACALAAGHASRGPKVPSPHADSEEDTGSPLLPSQLEP